MAELLGIAFSDLHLHKFTEYKSKASRLTWSLTCFAYIAQVAKKLRVPVFFTGDLFHNEKELENEVGSSAIETFFHWFELEEVMMYAISGNHDFSQRNGLDNQSPSHLNKFDHFNFFTLLDNREVIERFEGDGIYIKGIPYMDNDAHVLKEIKVASKYVRKKNGFKILMLHQDLPGAVTPAGFETKEYNALGNIKYRKLFRDWDIVLCGHIHKPQKLFKNVFMIGSPIHQIRSDEGTKMGYWKIYRDRDPKFVSLNKKFPNFITLKEGQTPYNDKDYFLEMPKSILVDKKIKKKQFSISNSRSKLAKNYCTIKNIKSKPKIKALQKILSEV